MSAQYLVYDAECTTCVWIAKGIQQVAGSKLALLDLNSAQARELLDQALPQGWDFAPHVVEVDGNRVRAWTEGGMSVQLARTLGVWRALRAWSKVRAVLGAKGALLLSVRNPATAFACDPCVYAWCGRCQPPPGDCRNPCGLPCC